MYIIFYEKIIRNIIFNNIFNLKIIIKKLKINKVIVNLIFCIKIKHV